MHIQYLGDAIPKRVHDPGKDLKNPNPRTDWKPGDTCFFYHVTPHLVRLAVVVKQWPDGACTVMTVDETPGKELVVDPDELFATKEALLDAFFRENADGQGRKGEN